MTTDERMINDKYFNLLRLAQVIQRPNGNFNFRCPICGDSKKSTVKMRGWFNPEKGTFSCYNCSHPHNRFDKFLTQVAPHLLSDYQMERKKAYINSIRKKEDKPLIDVKKVVQKPENSGIILPESKLILELSDNHPARQYLYKRRLPLPAIMQIKFCIDKTYEEGIYYNRIIFPLIRESDGYIYGFQARSLDGREPKYLTVVEPNHHKIWNMYNVNWNRKVYCLEGIIDAMFVKNSIAATGGSWPKEFLDEHRQDSLRFVFDNDLAGREFSAQIAQLGFNVFIWPKDIWPKNIPYKDINECILNGVKPPITDDSFYYTGKEALCRLRINIKGEMR